ncbi:MAG: signal peptidase I [Armatimonadota bacterium]
MIGSLFGNMSPARRIGLTVLLLALAAAVLGFRNLGVVQVVGNSMHPTLRSGERLWFVKGLRWLRPVRPGDIVTITGKSGELEGESVIKRVVFRQNGRGDAPWPEKITVPTGTFDRVSLFPDGSAECPLNVPNGVYVLGDNVDGSSDSREYGPVQERDIVGRVIGR